MFKTMQANQSVAKSQTNQKVPSSFWRYASNLTVGADAMITS